MNRKRIRSILALVLCAVLIGNIVYFEQDCMAAASVSLADRRLSDGALSGGIQVADAAEPELPSGGLSTPDAFRVDDEQAAKVPSYEGVSLYRARRSQTVFQQGTGTYGFSGLSEGQQEFYQSLETSLANFDRTDLTEAEFQPIQYQDGTVQYTPFKVNYIEAGIDLEQAKRTWVAFRADHPWLFWLGSIAYSNSELMPVVESTYEADLHGVREMYTTIEGAVSAYLDEADQADGAYEKVRVVYNHLIESIDYAYKADGSTPESADWAHSVVGVFDPAHNKSVCEGYAKALSFILNILNVPNVYIVGQAGGGHAWNAVSFDGGDIYYCMDATWDDPKNSTNGNQYIFFAMPKTNFEKRHTPDPTTGNGFDWQYAMPTFGDTMDYTYFVRYAAYGTAEAIGDVDAARAFVKRAKVLAPDEKCRMLLTNIEVMGKVAEALELGGYSYSMAEDYGMPVLQDTADSFEAKVPATAISLSKTELAVGDADAGEQIITISTVTTGSDDYITFYSSNERVADVITPYVKAEQGEEIHIVIRGTGAATIYAKSSAGKTKASCEITVGGSAEPTAEPTADPGVTPTKTPGVTPTEEPGVKPTTEPGVTSTEEPGVKPTKNPEEKPTAEPGVTSTEEPGVSSTEKPDVKPTRNPEATPTGNPGVRPTRNPEATATGNPGVRPTKNPGTTPTEDPDVRATTEPGAISTADPGVIPTKDPGVKPTIDPGATPTEGPVVTPTEDPGAVSTTQPGVTSTAGPDVKPTTVPDALSTVKPSETPSANTGGNEDETGQDTERKEQNIKKGNTFIAGNLKYKVTKIKGTKGELSVIGVKSKKTKSLVIPKNVKKSGITFTITSIQANAFKGCKKVKKLSIKTTGLKKVTKKSWNGLSRKLKISLPKSKAAQYRKMLRKCNYFLK